MEQDEKIKVYEKEGILTFMTYSVIHDELPVGNYLLQQNPQSGEFYLVKQKPFTYPSKIYGNVMEDVKFYADAYRSTEKNLGIVLNGEKGSGKTLLSTLLCKEIGIPVIMITKGFGGTNFIEYLDNIRQPIVFFVDEFDKIYAKDREDQETGQIIGGQTDLLRIMDAGNQSRKLFLFTSNQLALSQFMINRPSRIRYRQAFEKLDDSVVNDVLEDRLTETTRQFKEDFVQVANIYGSFNLDTLLTLVDEVNRHKKSPKEVIKRMNITPEEVHYEVSWIEGDKEYKDAYWAQEFDILEDQFIPNANFVEEDEKGSQQIRRQTRAVKVLDFNITTSKHGFIMQHKTQKYTLNFKRKKREIYKYPDF